MQTFSDMLRQLMSANHYTTYQLAQLSGVNRTTIQRALTSGRCPQKSAFEKLSAGLNLTPGERELFYATYERASEGDFHYFCRKHMQTLLENSESIAQLIEKPIEMRQKVSPLEAFPAKTLTHGFHNICRLFRILLSQESEKNKKPEISLAFPSDNQLFDQFFQDLDSYAPSPFSARHLIFLARNPSIMKDYKNYNLNLLANLLPYIILKGSDYEIHYMYRNYVGNDTDYSCFPYYILFSECALMFSSDFSTALLEREPELISYLLNRFNLAFDQAPRLLQVIPLWQHSNEEVKHSENSKFTYSMGYQPCLSSLLNETLCTQITDMSISKNASIIKCLLSYNQKLLSIDDNINIFHEKSLEDFIHYGMIAAISPELARPLLPIERLQVLTALYTACQKDTPIFRIINPLAFSLPQHLSMKVTGKNCVDLYFYNNSTREYQKIHILENTLFETFADFLSYLPRSTMVHAKEDTLKIIDKYRLQLECMIE